MASGFDLGDAPLHAARSLNIAAFLSAVRRAVDREPPSVLDSLAADDLRSDAEDLADALLEDHANAVERCIALAALCCRLAVDHRRTP